MKEDKEFSRGRDSLRIEANYLLVADNLLDLSHANFLHSGILGFPEHGNAAVTTEASEGKVHVLRFMPSVPVPRLHDLLFKRDGKPVDMWNNVQWDSPGCLKLTHGVSRPGASRTEPFEYTAVHLLVPETATSTHYSYGIVRRPVADEADIQKTVAETRRFVFEEQDRLFLEAQQKMLEEPSLSKSRPVMFGVDSASIKMRRLVEERIQSEQAPLTK